MGLIAASLPNILGPGKSLQQSRGLIHKARGRVSNRSHNEGIRKYAVELFKTRYADFGPTLATEMLLDKHQLRIGKETLRRWMMAEGLWLSRTQRRTFHQPRLRRESYGGLIQIDGSDHRWFEQRGDGCSAREAKSKIFALVMSCGSRRARSTGMAQPKRLA